MEDEFIALVVDESTPYEREALARGSAGHEVDFSVPGCRTESIEAFGNGFSQRLRLQGRDVGAKGLGRREIELMRRSVDRVVLDGRRYVEASLFQSERQAARAGKQIDCDRPLWSSRIIGWSAQDRLRLDSSADGQGIARSRAESMTDTRTKEQRSRIMAAVKGKNTSPELALRRALFEVGARGWRNHYKRASGTPDLAWPRLKVAIFVDGAFWHGHPSRHKPGRSGAYWDEKIANNMARDRRVDRELEKSGWLVLRIWDFEVKKDLAGVVDGVLEALRSRLAERSGAAAWERAVQQTQRSD